MTKITTEQMVQHFVGAFANKNSRTHYFSELRLGTGWSNEQRADGYLMELWPSNDFSRTAFEFKVGRGDFLKELKSPQKRQSVKSYANYFVIVTANDIVKDASEIPQDCGWYVFDGEKLDIKIKPPRLPPATCADWSFVCSLVRHARKELTNET